MGENQREFPKRNDRLDARTEENSMDKQKYRHHELK